MPIRIMNWNIEQFSWNKAQIPGTITAIARTIFAQNIDLLVIVEVKHIGFANTMDALCTALNGLAGNNDYMTWCLSYRTGGEYYGFIIRDLNRIRPVQVATGPTGSNVNRIGNLFQNQFTTWPATFAGTPNAYPTMAGPAPWQGPFLPLVQLYSDPDRQRGNKRTRFAGDALSAGGYGLGQGFRVPCMALFEILAAPPTTNTLLPIVVCHYMASSGPAGGQMRQLKDLHISQHFNNGQYIDFNGAATRIEELLFTGDFNVDFLSVNPLGTAAQVTAARSYGNLTPTVSGGGSGAPAAAPGPAAGVPGTAASPIPFPFAGPYVSPPYPAKLQTSNIPILALRVAATTEDTHLKPLTSTPPTTLQNMRDNCYDNFIYGGTRLCAGLVQIPCPVGNPAPAFGPPGGDSELTVDLANNIRLSGDPTIAAAANSGLYDVAGPANHHTLAGTRGAAAQPNLQAVWAGPPIVNPVLSIIDRWVGAKLISDHLPTVIDVNLP
jgi:hypothetical protein